MVCGCKKPYVKPCINIDNCLLEEFICTSGVKSEEKGINYGGVDEEGSLTPGSRGFGNIWDEE